MKETITEQVSHILRSKSKSVVEELKPLQPNSLFQDQRALSFHGAKDFLQVLKSSASVWRRCLSFYNSL